MASLINRLWNTSPASLTRAVHRRLRTLRAGEEWRAIQGGPAQGARMKLPLPAEPWVEEVIAGTFDRFLHEALRRHRSLAGARCWDIGANIGYHSLAFAAQGANVVAFEPNGTNADRLQLHIDHNKQLADRIKVQRLAVADRDGELRFVASGDLKGASSGSHLSEATPPLGSESYATFHECVVPAVTLDTLIEQRGEAVPDVIKLDVEGAEHLVLQGGRRMLARHHPLLLVEVHHICVMQSLTETLLGAGYQIEFLDRENATPSRCFILARDRRQASDLP